MPETLEGKARELVDAANFAHIATLGKGGRPQINPVWVDADDDHIVVNSAEGRAWPANLRRDPRVTISIANQENPYEYATIWGRVVDETHDGAKEHADRLAKKYMGVDEYPFLQPGEQRVIFRIEPERVHVNAG